MCKRGAVASLILRSPSDGAVWVRTLPRDIVVCSWVGHFSLTVPLSNHVDKWVLANLMLEATLP